TMGEFMLVWLRGAQPEDVSSLFGAVDDEMSGGFDLGASLNSDLLGGLSGGGGGFDDFEDDFGTDVEDDFGFDDDPADSGGFTETGYDRYYDACGDLEFAVLDATTNAEWGAAVVLANACAVPFLQSGDIVPDDLLEEVAYPECYPAWPYDPNLTLQQQSDLFTQIDACVSTKG
ncbi:MAG: hypothetical protein AB7W59_12255, partial [Acidimicrobiia bacterium]